MTDEQIIELYWNRDEIALSETKVKYEKLCHSIAVNILANSSDAEECVSDTYLSIWNSIPDMRPTNFKAWICKLTRNISLDLYRKMTAKKRGNGEVNLILDELEDCIPASLTVEQQYDSNNTSNAISEFLMSIPKEQRIVFTRRYWYGDSIEFISTKYYITQSKTKSILFRNRQKLKLYLEKEGITL